MEFDKDLRSIQEARDKVAKAKKAQKVLASMDQAAIDRIVTAISQAAAAESARLARLAAE